MTLSIDELLSKRKIIITCGTGGVGKTTLSAAIALRAALRGLKTVVITIDPAKRLATSLGIQSLGDQPTDLTAHIQEAATRLRAQGVQAPEIVSGSLSAIMPDTRRTFEELVKDLGFSTEGASRIVNNPIFQIFAREFSGTNEYMAVQRLYRLHRDGEFDCIILDTPPSRNTLDFLNAPSLLSRFYEDRIFHWMIIPSSKIAAAGMRKALGILERLTGANFMTHLMGFAASLFEVQESFMKNLKEVSRLLEGELTGFLLVASPAPEHAREVGHFTSEVERHRYRFDGLILNRSLGYLGELGTPPPGPAWAEAAAILSGLQARERRGIQELSQIPGAPTPLLLPELARDVHSVEDLLHVALALDPSTPLR